MEWSGVECSGVRCAFRVFKYIIVGNIVGRFDGRRYLAYVGR